MYSVYETGSVDPDYTGGSHVVHPEILQSDLLPLYMPVKSTKPHVGTVPQPNRRTSMPRTYKKGDASEKMGASRCWQQTFPLSRGTDVGCTQTAVKGKIRDSPHLFCATGKEPGLFGAERCSWASFRLRDFLTVLSWFPPHHASITRRKPLPMGGERIAKTPTSSLTGICGPFLVARFTYHFII